MVSKIGILAGAGALPRQVAEACRAAGREVFVVAFKGRSDAKTTEGFAHIWVRLGSVGKILDVLRAESVGDVCLVGHMHRPSMRELLPDRRAMAFLTRSGALRLGDDGLLRAIAAEFEREGFNVLGVPDLLHEVLAKEGSLAGSIPDDEVQADIRRGLQVARGLGALDVGQAAVVQQGVVLAVEAAEGTDAMLARCRDLRRDGPGGVLVKARKPQQDDRLDLPTIGPDTVDRAAAAGLRGIAVEAGGALIVDLDRVATQAERLGLFVVAVA